jgi:hypothetical protein
VGKTSTTVVLPAAIVLGCVFAITHSLWRAAVVAVVAGVAVAMTERRRSR